MLGLLLRQRVRLAWNRVVRGPRRGRRLVGTLLGVVFTGGFLLVAGLNTGQLALRIARTDLQAGPDAVAALLVGVTGLTLVTSLSSAFHHLFLAGDLELLHVAPVAGRALFWLKVLEIWRDSLHVLLFQAAALFAYGQSLRLPLTYYPVALTVGITLTIGAAAVATAITLLVARVRFGESMLGASRLVAILLFLPIGALGVPAFGFGRGRFVGLVGQDTVQAAATGLREIGPPPVWAPTTWAAHVLLGDDAAWLSAGLLLAGAILVFAVGQLTYDALFQPAWERLRFTGPRRPSRSPRPARARWPALAVPSGPIAGVLQKDWRTLVRDPRWRTGAVISLVALGLPAALLFAGDPFARLPHVAAFWFGLLPVPYLAYLLGSQQGAATLAYEGRNMALLQAAPIGIGRILLAKILGGLGLVLSFTWLITVALAISHHGEPIEVAFAVLAATWLATGGTLSAVTGTALTADFEADNPQRRVGWLGTLLTSAMSLFFFLTNTGLAGWWVARVARAVPRPLLGVAPVVDIGLPLAALLSVLTLLVAWRLAMRRLAAWEAS